MRDVADQTMQGRQMTSTPNTPQLGAQTTPSQGQQQQQGQQTPPGQMQQGGGKAPGTSFTDWASI
ncbi:hypothetical protein N8I71_13775 [Roseibacterium sp. SDUM158016]|jgi:hypothetical protein|nr:hypothetical protein [Roseibacterium sp. SDUM158016]